MYVGRFSRSSGVGALSYLIRPSLSLSRLCCGFTLGISLVVRRADGGRFYRRCVSCQGESPASSLSKGAVPALLRERWATSAGSEGSGNLEIQGFGVHQLLRYSFIPCVEVPFFPNKGSVLSTLGV